MTASPAAALRPLAGRRVVVTRAATQAASFRRLLEAAGAEVIEAPAIAIEPPDSWAPLDEAIRRIGDFAWVVFTSVNGVTMFERRLQRGRRGWPALARCRVAAIGPATAAALTARGVEPLIVPEEYRAEALAERLRPLVRAGEHVLLPRAAEARDVLPRELAALGARVVEVAAYHTRATSERAPAARAALELGGVDVVTFTSPSTARGFLTSFPAEARARLFGDVVIAAIGPVTAEAVTALGLTARIVPDAYTIPALAAAIAGYFTTSSERS